MKLFGKFLMDDSLFHQAKTIEEIKGKEAAWDFIEAVSALGLFNELPDPKSEVWLYGFDIAMRVIDDDEYHLEKIWDYPDEMED